MKKLILSLLLPLFAATAFAQDAGNSQWLTEFSEIDIKGPFSVTFVQVADTEAPRIVFDTKGSYTSKFKAEVKNNVLTITEKYESARSTVTEAKIYCHTLAKIRISAATVTFATPVKGVMADVVIGGGAVVTLPCELTDLSLDVSGKSRVTLTGEVRYLTLMASTATVEGAQLKVTSAMADASNKAEVRLDVTERLAAKASTGAVIRYSGNPPIVRVGVSFTGGDIVKID